MIIIAESGSTKIDWRIIHPDNSQETFFTEGFNPNYHPKELLVGYLSSLSDKIKLADAGEIYFYGSGCSTDQAKAIVKSAIHTMIPDANVEVWHDLFGAARALFGTGSGIASILGTGSSSCLFNNGEIISAVPSLGYLLADEGSGMQLGRLLLNAYFKRDLSSKLSGKFREQYNLEFSTFLPQLYSHPKPNSLIASFVPFMVENQHDPDIKVIVRTTFNDFFAQILLKYPDCRQLKLGFVGSVAFLFQNLLNETASMHGLIISHIIQNPVVELIKFHSSKNDQ